VITVCYETAGNKEEKAMLGNSGRRFFVFDRCSPNIAEARCQRDPEPSTTEDLRRAFQVVGPMSPRHEQSPTWRYPVCPPTPQYRGKHRRLSPLPASRHGCTPRKMPSLPRRHLLITYGGRL